METPDRDRVLADALLRWYDKTHGNEFGHDHHCPLSGDSDDVERCTCLWAGVIVAEKARALADE